jgi:hypothetical protein
MVAYQPEAWHDFFTATTAAAAAVTGLLFVALSINLAAILKEPRLPGRAAGTLVTLVSMVLVSAFALAPGQSLEVLGIEVAVIGSIAVTQALVVSVRKPTQDYPPRWLIGHLSLLLLPALGFLGGGVSLAVGAGGGFYWLLGAVVIGFATASINAWVLLVEILR